jgi:ketosteroid isomerase-like protein
MAAAQDADGVTRTWANNVVWYDLAPPPELDGKAAAVKETVAQFKAITNLRTKILRMSVGASGDLGYAFSTQEFISDLKQGGPGLDFIFRETDIFRKKAGKWRLIHQHLSVPVNMATGKAVITNKDWLAPAAGR